MQIPQVERMAPKKFMVSKFGISWFQGAMFIHFQVNQQLNFERVKGWIGWKSLATIFHLSSDQNHGWLGYIGDDILPSYIGIIISHYKDPH